MDLATLSYIYKGLKLIRSGERAGLYTLWGRGENSAAFNASGLFVDNPAVKTTGPKGDVGYVAEVKNATINQGVAVTGHNFYGYPFYLKVNGTLTINGNLNMDGMGAANNTELWPSTPTERIGNLPLNIDNVNNYPTSGTKTTYQFNAASYAANGVNIDFANPFNILQFLSMHTIKQPIRMLIKSASTITRPADIVQGSTTTRWVFQGYPVNANITNAPAGLLVFDPSNVTTTTSGSGFSRRTYITKTAVFTPGGNMPAFTTTYVDTAPVQFSPLTPTPIAFGGNTPQPTFSDLMNYGGTDGYFTMKYVAMGAGASRRNPGLQGYADSIFNVDCRGNINGGGDARIISTPAADTYKIGGGGGGFIVLIYETLTNNTNTIPYVEDNISYPTNIHANGSSNTITTGTGVTVIPTYRGGGTMIIAARNIVIGPQGSITADAQLGGNGSAGLINRSNISSPILYGTGDILRPVSAPSNCFYDKVSKTFFENETSTELAFSDEDGLLFSGTQRINSQVIPNDRTKIRIVFKTSTPNRFVFGSRSAYASPDQYGLFISYGNPINPMYGSVHGDKNISNTILNNSIEYIMDDGKIYINGTQELDLGKQVFDGTYPCYIGNILTGPGFDYRVFDGSIKELQIWQSGELIRDLVSVAAGTTFTGGAGVCLGYKFNPA